MAPRYFLWVALNPEVGPELSPNFQDTTIWDKINANRRIGLNHCGAMIKELRIDILRLPTRNSEEPNIFEEIKSRHHGLIDKLGKILADKNNIKRIRCAVKSSLWLIEQIDTILGHPERDAIKIDIRILKRPDRLALIDYVNSTFGRDPSPDIFLDGREKDIKLFLEKYIDRCKIMKRLPAKEYDLGRIAFLTVEYNDGKKGLLFIVFDTGPRMNRVGLYTEEAYIIDVFDNIFDCAWDNAPNYDPDKSELLEILK